MKKVHKILVAVLFVGVFAFATLFSVNPDYFAQNPEPAIETSADPEILKQTLEDLAALPSDIPNHERSPEAQKELDEFMALPDDEQMSILDKMWRELKGLPPSSN